MEFLSGLFNSLWAIFLIVLFFGGSIFVHELGHFIAARRRGVKVTRFSIGFGPAIWKRTGKDGVEYRLSWIPLGGYVALPQLADMAAIEGEDEAGEPLPPVSYPTRMIVFAAGAFFNILFAFLLATVLWQLGEPVSSNLASTTVAEVLPTIKNSEGKNVPSPASQAGLQPGDVIVKIDGRAVDSFSDIVEHLALGSGWSKSGEREAVFSVLRDGQPRDIAITPVLSGDDKIRMVGFAPVGKFVVGKLTPGSPAEAAGFQVDDQIIAVAGTRVLTGTKLLEALRTHAGQPFEVKVLRNDREVALQLPAIKAGTDLGFLLKSGTVYAHTPPWVQIGDCVAKTFRNVWALINPRSDIGLSHLSGPIGIGKIYWDASTIGFRYVLWIAILVNVNLAIFNLLPIPVLDGGHMLFATIGRLRGKALPVNFIAATQSVFIVLLFTMIIYVSVFDVRRIARDVRNDTQAKESAEAAKKTVEPAPAKP